MSEKRVRSPNYPAISLPAAIERISVLYKNQNRHAAPRDVVAKGLGFRALSGPAATIISALSKYGLLERVTSGEVKISERALQILFPNSPAERQGAIQAAAGAPQLFAELNERFQGGVSDTLLRNYLTRRNFSAGALDDTILAFEETAEFVSQEVRGNDSPADSTEAERTMATANVTTQKTDLGRLLVPPRPEQPMISIMNDGKLVVNATLADRESVEALITMLNAVKQVTPQRAQPETEQDE